MEFKEIQELIKLISKSNLAEFKLEEGDLKLSIRTKHFNKGKAQSFVSMPAPMQPMMQQAPAATPAPVEASAKKEKKPIGEEE